MNWCGFTAPTITLPNRVSCLCRSPCIKEKSNPIMSGKLKKSAALNNPFSAKVLAEAKEIARHYQVILHCEEGTWFGRGLEMPQVFGDGTSVNRCMENTREALIGAVALMLESGEKPPPPAQIGQRTKQVNIRLTDDEFALLKITARNKGFSGLSDYLRAAALESMAH
jgi:predicted RNase H-like HicB family nuclease